MDKLIKNAIAVLLIFASFIGVAYAAIWSKVYKITSNTWANENPYISIDNKNNIHVVYLQDSSWEQRDLKYKVKYASSSSWSLPVTIDKEVAASLYVISNNYSIASYNGKAHVVYDKAEDLINGEGIFYKTNKSGTWSKPIKLFGDHNDCNPVIAQENGKLFLIFNRFDGNDSEIYFSKNVTGSWTKPTPLTNNQDSDGAVDMVVKNGNIHVALAKVDQVGEGAYEYSKSSIRYKSFSNGAWSKMQTLASSPTNSYSPSSIALYKGKPVIAYETFSDIGITFPDSSGKWVKKTIANSGQYPRIIASDANLAVVWQKITRVTLKPRNFYSDIFSASLGSLSGNWIVSNLTNTSDKHEVYSDIALDSNGKSHIVYQGEGSKSLEIMYQKEL